MTDSIKQQFELYSNALRIRNRKNEILASNIANAATPNFKARDMDFEVELARALSVGPMKTSNNAILLSPPKIYQEKFNIENPCIHQWMGIQLNWQLNKQSLLKMQ